MSTVDLAKMLLIYQYLFMTDNPNSKSREAKKKIRAKLRHILTHQNAKYKAAQELQRTVYADGWKKAFGDVNTGLYVSLGTFMTIIYNSIGKQTLIGDKVMLNLFNSYFHCPSAKNLTHDEELEMEQNTNKLAKEVRILLGDTIVDSPLSRMRQIHKQNMIIEGKEVTIGN